jgi:hypothetical protein
MCTAWVNYSSTIQVIACKCQIVQKILKKHFRETRCERVKWTELALVGSNVY